MTLLTKMKSFTTLLSRKFLETINDMLHWLFAMGIQARDIYPELKKCFYKEH